MINSTNKNHKVPPRYFGVKYEEIPDHILIHSKKMFKEKKGLYIFGGCGTGKTHIAYAIWQRCQDKDRKCRFYKSTELLDLIREFYGKSDTQENQLNLIMNYTGLLIIDDLGAEKPTEWVEETFYKIIDKRYEEMLPTVFTSNLDLGVLAEKISDRLTSRIAEMCEIIKVDGEDKRIK